MVPATVMMSATISAAAVAIAYGINHAAGKHCRDRDGNNKFDCFHGTSS